MPVSSANSPSAVESFRENLLASGILDYEGIHHEFAYGSHGQKLDFDRIKLGTHLYSEWVGVCSDSIRSRYPKLPDAVLGIANGTNRLSESVASSLGIVALYTEKVSGREVAVTKESLEIIKTKGIEVVVALEDVGTTGGTALTGAESALAIGVSDVEVQFTWKRQPELSAFENSEVPYYAIIDEPIETFSPEDCFIRGLCAKNWGLIRHGK